ncbi:MAG: VWA domain-containing protein [Thermoleophilia bacterium]
MIWQHPIWFFALVVVAIAAVMMVASVRRRRALAGAYADPSVMAVGVLSRRARTLRTIAAVFVLLGLTSGVVAMADPAIEKVGHEQRGTVMIAIDTSHSMLKTDLTPSRLGAALDAARRFVGEAPDNVQIGLVAFNGSTTVVQQPTTDHAALRDALNRRFGNIDEGTAIGDAVVTSLNALKVAGLTTPADTPADSTYRMLVLTDGAEFKYTVTAQEAGCARRRWPCRSTRSCWATIPGSAGDAGGHLGGLASTTGGTFAQTATTGGPAGGLRRTWASRCRCGGSPI